MCGCTLSVLRLPSGHSAVRRTPASRRGGAPSDAVAAHRVCPAPAGEGAHPSGAGAPHLVRHPLSGATAYPSDAGAAHPARQTLWGAGVRRSGAGARHPVIGISGFRNRPSSQPEGDAPRTPTRARRPVPSRTGPEAAAHIPAEPRRSRSSRTSPISCGSPTTCAVTKRAGRAERIAPAGSRRADRPGPIGSVAACRGGAAAVPHRLYGSCPGCRAPARDRDRAAARDRVR